MIWAGCFSRAAAEPDTGTPDPVMGYAAERVLRSPCAGSGQACA